MTTVKLVSYNEEGDYTGSYEFDTKVRSYQTDKLTELALEKFPALLEETSFTIEASTSNLKKINYKLITRCGL